MKTAIKSQKFPLTDVTGTEVGIILFEHLWADVFAFKIKISKLEGIAFLGRGLKEAMTYARRTEARLIMCRLQRDDFGTEEIKFYLQQCGFEKKSQRLEFKKQVSQLPDDNGSPLTWKTAKELSWGPEKLGPLLKEIAQDDPDTDPNEDPIAFMQDFLEDPVLTSGLTCIHIGFLKDEIAALTVVQINPTNGWSRISYMGILPRFRKRSLGKWVHRYGFKMMKSEGGLTYIGGTNTSNTSMIRLFEISGCDKFREMDEWHCVLKGA
jgi:hypothetical protein